MSLLRASLTHGDLRLVSGPYWTYSGNPARVALLTTFPLLAHALGGFVAGRLIGSSLGMNGVLTAVVCATVAGGKTLVGVLSIVLSPDPDAVPFSEQAGFFFALAGLFVVYLPFTIVAGYLGGRLGGRLQGSSGT